MSKLPYIRSSSETAAALAADGDTAASPKSPVVRSAGNRVCSGRRPRKQEGGGGWGTPNTSGEETGDGRRETGDGRQEIGDRRQEIGDRRPEIGGRKQEVGDRRRETGDGRQETGDRRQDTGDRRQEIGDMRYEI